MPTLVLSVELVVDIPVADISVAVISVRDNSGADRTEDFRNFCSEGNIPLDTQEAIGEALADYARSREKLLR